MTFDISFEPWYQAGYWQESYIPYSLAVGDEVAANVSVNLMEFCHGGSLIKMIQLGTVMTHPQHRGLGLSRLLLEEILAGYQGQAELIYLFANDSVLEFYPKFGFEAAEEYGYSFTPATTAQPTPIQKLDLSLASSAETLLRCYGYGNPLSALYSVGNEGLFMFHAALLKEHIYYLPAYDAVMIAEIKDHTMTLYELLGREEIPLTALIPEGVTQLRLGFAPKNATGFDFRPLGGENNTLFVLKGGEAIFERERLCFPLLSHA